MPSSVEPLTAAELEDLTRNLLSDNINMVGVAPDSLSPQTWSTQQVYDALNFAIKEYCKATNASYMEREASLDGDGFASIPSAYLKVENVFYPSTALGSKPLYIRTNYPAAAVDKTAIYICKNNAIYIWDAVAGFEYLWAKLPDYIGDIYDIQISDDSLHLLTHGIITAYANGDYGESIQTTRYTRPLDGSSDWVMDDQWGWVEWWGPGWDDLYATEALTFPDGKTLYVGDFQWHPNHSYQRGSRNWISGEQSSAYGQWTARDGIYYANAGRTLIGGKNPNSSAAYNVYNETRDPQITRTMPQKTWFNLWGVTRMVYTSDASGVHAELATYTGDAGGYYWVLTDHVYPGASLSGIAPVPFADKSLMILSDGTCLWWDGTNFTHDIIGSDSSVFAAIQYENASVSSTDGKAYSLNDGSVLHIGTGVKYGYGTFGVSGGD